MENEAPALPRRSGSFPFVFSDEAGVPAMSPTEPFFGIGLLELDDVGRWNCEINRLLDRFVASASRRGVTKPRTAYELKFSSVTRSTVRYYESAIDYFVTRPDASFTAVVVDKRAPDTNPITMFGSSYEALIACTAIALRKRARPHQRVIVIADNYQKPKALDKYFEAEITRALGNRVANVAMIESHGSGLLQLVDILLGAVMYHWKRAVLRRVDAEKLALADRLANAYGVPHLGAALQTEIPNAFEIWPLRALALMQEMQRENPSGSLTQSTPTRALRKHGSRRP